MTKDEFRRLRNTGCSIEFVDFGGEIAASISPTPMPFADGIIAFSPLPCVGRKIKVRYVPFGGDLMLSLSPTPFVHDFFAWPSPLMVSSLAWVASAFRK